jgi:hypothetical protein
MLRILVAVLCLALPSAALAAGGGKKQALEPHVDLAAMGLPVVVDGRAVNYVFVQVRLNVAPGQDTAKLRAQEPFYRDAIVRAAHRQPFVKGDDWTVLDEARLKAVALAEARRISGAKAFAGVEVIGSAPRRRAGMRPRAAAPAPKTAKTL